MAVSTWLERHGEDAQFGAYFGALLLFALLERRFAARPQLAARAPRWRANFVLTALNVVVLSLLPLSLVTAARFAEARSLGLFNAVSVPLGVAVVLNLAGRAFISWLTHLLMHAVPLFWRVHRVHHTDTELDVSTTVRFHPLEFPIGLAVGLPLVLVLGLSPWLLLLYELLDVLVTLFSHSNLELPAWLERPLRYLIVTPGLHRVHHSTLPEETDSNFGAVFPLWDLIFGTFRRTTRLPTLTMPLGLSELRDQRARSVTWLLTSPLRGELASADASPSVDHAATAVRQR
jgi:sterol desaturase/sphingolipid hydroxylase (fatty acid hydroxylase superfamily)